MTTAHDALVSCITRWLPVLDEPELRAVEGFVLELVIAAREHAIDLSARGLNDENAPPRAVTPRADAISPVELGLRELVDNAPDPEATWPRDRFDLSDGEP